MIQFWDLRIQLPARLYDTMPPAKPGFLLMYKLIRQ